MKPEQKRWLVMAVGLVANVCQGMAYTSSVFMLPLGEALGRPRAEWSREWGFIFAMCLAFLPAGMLMSGKLADYGKTRLTVALGALLFGGGLFLAGFGTSVLWIAVTLGVMTSIGSGSAYGTVIGTMVRWFPDRRGLASGLAVAAVGVGPIILAPIARSLEASHGVMAMFKILGVASFIAMGLAALYVTNPPEGYRPEGWTPPEPDARASRPPVENLAWRRMIGRGLFWLLYLAYIAGAFAGVLVSGLASPIAIELAGMTASGATFAVMLFALSNAGGRVLWGFLSDLAGRMRMLAVAFVLTAISMFILYWHVGTPGVYLPCLAAAGMCYGGVLGTFPSLNADSFGIKHAAMNLAVLFTSFSVVAVIAPQVLAHYRNGGPAEYPKAFLAAGCVAVAGVILSILIMGRKQRG
ncbi:MAG: OFA family MFS transporter [Planctomycetota bacterium]|jgi:OFA family oxalate/formate antiporter-like MFS transporter|nr:OFA family MFS transporter [Planctomycetota bacterium]